MKFYSEKLNELFDSEDALKIAEAEGTIKKKSYPSSAKSATNKKADEVQQPSRKELAAEVEAAEEAATAAYAEYEIAKEKVQELSKKYLEDVDAIMTPAKEMVKSAQQAKYNAVKKFNDSYGSYQVMYTGDKAAQELIKTLSDLDSHWRNFFRFPL